MAKVGGTCQPLPPWVGQVAVHAVGGGQTGLGVAHPLAHGQLCVGLLDCLSLGTVGVELSPNLNFLLEIYHQHRPEQKIHFELGHLLLRLLHLLAYLKALEWVTLVFSPLSILHKFSYMILLVGP